MKRIGLALGAGGARGLAHIKILEAFDELGIQPSIISGSSIGAVIGAAYASGLTAKEISSKVEKLIKSRKSKAWEFYRNSEIKLLFNLVDLELNSGGFIKGEKFRKFLDSEITASSFEELKIPLKVVATNYNKKTQKIFDKRELLPAITASYSLPGLFVPTKIGRHAYVDGGMVNPLPYDIIKDECDVTIAIDVSATKSAGGNGKPPFYEIVFTAFQIMQTSIMNEKLNKSNPDYHIKTEIKDVRMLDFAKFDEIMEQAGQYKTELLKILKNLIDG